MLTKLFDDHKLAMSVLATVGFLFIAKFLHGLVSVISRNVIASRKNKKDVLKKYKDATKYALITGSTDGIGKQFAIQLAELGFNLILISRSGAKLETVKAEILASVKAPVEIELYAFDFAKYGIAELKTMEMFLKSFQVNVLINNVGVSHSIPTTFLEETQETIDNIIQVNISSTQKLTQMILPQMVLRKSGLILNVGSMSGMVPVPLLQVYSASKAYLRFWSLALAEEVKPHGVHVEHLNVYFVVSNMSKIKRPSVVVPSAKTLVDSALRRVGKSGSITPYSVHDLLDWVLGLGLVSEAFIIKRGFFDAAGYT